MRMQISALTCALSVLLSVADAEQAPPDSKSEAAPHEQTAIELFTAPRPKHIDMESYPAGELGKEGWVELAFMVDTSGKPFEVTVTRSTGNETFDKVAMTSIEHSSFEPGKLNGTPVESGYEMKYRFASPALEREPGANREFVKTYSLC
jgi:TonB family protein